jgi:hypothetical protein
MSFFAFLNSYYISITAIVTALSLIIGGFWSILQFNENIKDKRFKTYHELIDELVNEQRQPDRHIKLDRQIAIVYELRNFKKYFPVSIRILEGLKESWKNIPSITKEIELSISYMKTKKWYKPFFKNS